MSTKCDSYQAGSMHCGEVRDTGWTSPLQGLEWRKDSPCFQEESLSPRVPVPSVHQNSSTPYPSSQSYITPRAPSVKWWVNLHQEVLSWFSHIINFGSCLPWLNSKPEMSTMVEGYVRTCWTAASDSLRAHHGKDHLPNHRSSPPFWLTGPYLWAVSQFLGLIPRNTNYLKNTTLHRRVKSLTDVRWTNASRTVKVFSERQLADEVTLIQVWEQCKFISMAKCSFVKGKSILLVHYFLNGFCKISQGLCRLGSYTD